MNLASKSLSISLAVIVAVALTGCGKEAPPPPPVQAAPAPAPAVAAPSATAAAAPGAAPTATPTAAPAISNKALAAKNGCLACHAIDKKMVGPAYQDIAKKYTASDEAKLIANVKSGSKGVWGSIPMPPNARVSDEDIKTLVNWILAGAK
ncbi:MAG: c-type cytochrome [Sulfuritalea sp.]|nr:c-type cytochrome [Sulfuritalea sp.]